ncbi:MULTISPECIES: TetR/AcrR family transcriptional regulator [unclassified Fictibacillus]|uniref:TetR/AcrR family transcriptional regulator n=1 Tax=unclassified Fictibacillus TaxID=2644029 RepID=UPI0006A785F7|nr:MULTISPECIES: TetR/AcrR family transcriptional regulator [unclassified Fictibacillus]MED2971041.1 TetR/AcrR family transcriptional regulator [Fictibacillus sp. B-59209]
MFSKFYNLEDEKQIKILNAAIKVYVQKGYDNASTNEIVKEAGISKGLLFHYFKNKKTLYLFLFDHCIEVVMEDFYKKVVMEETDFFKRLHDMTLIKMELLHTYPDIFRFFEKAMLEESDQIRSDFQSRIKTFTASSSTWLFDGIDTSKFRDDLDLSKVIKSMLWAFEGLSEEILAKAKLQDLEVDYDEVFAEAAAYIEMFKKAFYK